MTTQAPRYFALIPAAGVGARMAAAAPKQYLQLGGKPMIRHTLDAFLSSERISHTYVVVSAADGHIDAAAPRHGVTRCAAAARAAWNRSSTACARCPDRCATTTGCWCTTPRVPA
jgi:2-C-methyl-D-erythritol 4-phosphate cytidylyltransferase